MIDPKDVKRVRKAQARKMGFSDLAAYEEAERAGNLAANGDDMAALAVRYIERDRMKVAGSREAAKAPRRGKWAEVRPEAVEVAARIAERRGGLTASSLSVLVLSELAKKHDDLPDRTTISRWVKHFVQ